MVNNKSFILFLVLVIFTVKKVTAQVKFSENLGQWESKILFKASLDAGNLFVESNCLTFNFYDAQKMRERHHASRIKPEGRDQSIKAHSYRISFVNSNNTGQILKNDPGSDYENFFLGKDKEKWRSGVRNYKSLLYKDLYDGIDYELIGTHTGLKYNFIVKAGADPSSIRLKYEGIDELKREGSSFSYSLSVDKVMEQSPVVWQNVNGIRKKVDCVYEIDSNEVTFNFPNGYNKNYDLIIDPVLVFAAQSGSNADNFGMTATWDGQGNFYSGGTAYDIGYPTTLGAFMISFQGLVGFGKTDVVVTKYSSNGNALIYSTYLGGAESEIVTSMIVDHSDNICLYGATSSFNFPVTAGAYDVTFNGGLPLSFQFNGTDFVNGTDIYIAKFNSTGTLLMGSTFLGGSGNDGVNHVNGLTQIQNNVFEYVCDSLQHNYGDQYRGEIRIDRFNNIYIASSTRSSDFPTFNAIDNSLGGKQDAVVSKFNPGLTQLLFSTFLGGSSNECGNSLIVNENEQVYITGGSCSPNFPTTPGAYSTVYSGGTADAFVSAISTTSSSLLYSSLLGTSNYDQSYFVQSDLQNNIYLFGQSLGALPVFGTGYSNPGTHQFISKFNSSLSSLMFNTTIGSNLSTTDISPSAFSVDYCGNIYLSGWGGGFITPFLSTLTAMPLMAATQSTTDGFDFYLMQLSPNAGALMYGSYFGGNVSTEHVDGGTSRIDKSGVFYQSVCAGCGGNDDFPVSPGAWPNTPGNPNHSFNCNNGIFKINAQSASLVSSNIAANVTSGCAPLTVTFSNVAVNYSTFLWHLAPGITNSVNLTPSITFTAAGIYSISLVVKNPIACNQKDSSVIFINVAAGPPPTITLSSSSNTICSGQSATLSAFGASSYSWNTGQAGQSIIVSPTVNTTYTVSGTTLSSCSNTATFTQSVVICTGQMERLLHHEIMVFPNPVSDRLNIIVGLSNSKFQLKNLLGEAILEKEVKQKCDLSIDHLSNGIYFYEIVDDQNRVIKAGKLIIEK